MIVLNPRQKLKTWLNSERKNKWQKFYNLFSDEHRLRRNCFDKI